MGVQGQSWGNSSVSVRPGAPTLQATEPGALEQPLPGSLSSQGPNPWVQDSVWNPSLGQEALTQCWQTPLSTPGDTHSSP